MKAEWQIERGLWWRRLKGCPGVPLGGLQKHLSKVSFRGASDGEESRIASSLGVEFPAVQPVTRWADDECGASIVEMAFLLPILLLLLIGLIDFGRAYYLSTEVSSAASAGALYGCQNTAAAQDTTGIKSAAIADAPNVSGLTVPTVSVVCECSGSTASVSCTTPGCSSSSHMIEWLTVGTSATYKPLFPYPGIPSSITLSGQATMRVGQ
jgi:Flp pilus assembly protein TadG